VKIKCKVYTPACAPLSSRLVAEVELTDTGSERQRFEPVAHGVAAESLEENQDWFVCEVKGKKFVAAGGPRKLDDMILAFVNWAGGPRLTNRSRGRVIVKVPSSNDSTRAVLLNR
jgi:hypothetical protein